MKAIPIREPYIGLILRGLKTWEMRSTRATHRGLVGLIKTGSLHVFGVARLIDSLPSLTRQNYAEYESFHRVAPADQPGAIDGKWVHPWVLADVRRLSRPVPYKHAGGVTWVNLDDDVVRRIFEQIGAQGTAS
jgi:hypothetical protein